MDGSVREIPGYYYDTEKQKYFKIQASSTAPASSAYSSEDVKRRMARDQRAEDENVLIARQKMQILRSRTLKHPLSGGLLERAHGRRTGIDAAEIYATGMIRQGGLRTPAELSGCSGPLFDINHRMDLRTPMLEVRMVFDDTLISTRVNADKYIRSTERGSSEVNQTSSIPTLTTINMANWSPERFGNAGDATSLSSHLESRTLAVTWLSGTTRAGVAVVPMRGSQNDPQPDRPRLLFGPGEMSDVAVWSSAPAPPSSAGLFAIGTSRGILAIDKDRCDVEMITPKFPDWDIYKTDVLALEYLSDNPSILLSGSRRGILNIHDLRLPFSDEDLIRHPSTITHIKQIDGHRVLVAGLKSSLCQYDLRFRKVDTPVPPRSAYAPNGRARKRGKQAKEKILPKRPREEMVLHTRPILTYPGYRNEATIKIGLDVDLETGVIAAAQECDEDHSMVELFSLSTGNRIPSEVAKASAMEAGADPARVVRCVKWVRDVEGRGKSLYVGGFNDVHRFAWGVGHEGEVEEDSGV